LEEYFAAVRRSAELKATERGNTSMLEVDRAGPALVASAERHNIAILGPLPQ
jgi:hypothetical protein